MRKLIIIIFIVVVIIIIIIIITILLTIFSKSCTLFFLIRTKALVLVKRFKNKLRTKPGLLSRRT